MNNNPLGNKIVSVIIILFFCAATVFFWDTRSKSVLSFIAGEYIGYLSFAIGILLAIVNWRNNIFKLKR